MNEFMLNAIMVIGADFEDEMNHIRSNDLFYLNPWTPFSEYEYVNKNTDYVLLNSMINRPDAVNVMNKLIEAGISCIYRDYNHVRLKIKDKFKPNNWL